MILILIKIFFSSLATRSRL